MASNHQVLRARRNAHFDLSPEPGPVVVGAGYAGVLCANRLARKTRAPVLLVAAQDSFLHRVRLHETAARGVSSELPLRPLLHPRIQLLQGSAVGLDPETQRLDVRDAAGTHGIT
jgi:NADH dehydrogenase